MKEIFAPHLGRNVKFGRRERKPGGTRIHFSDFVEHLAMPTIPSACDFSPKAASVLADIYKNDSLGDCVIAGGYHILGVWTGNATGTPFHATGAQIIADYGPIGGYVPGDASTDNGCQLQDAIKYWTQHGFANGTKLLGSVSVNARSVNDVKAVCFLTETLKFGVGLPDAWVDPFPRGNGFVWDVAGPANPNHGHDFIAYGFNAQGVLIDSWGLRGLITWAAVAAYAGPSANGELYGLFTEDIRAKGQAVAPNGVAWTDLVKAFDSMGGNVPVPAPPPPAPPAPTPGGVTLGQAQAWAAAGLQSGPWLISKDAAINNVKRSLQGNWPK